MSPINFYGSDNDAFDVPSSEIYEYKAFLSEIYEYKVFLLPNMELFVCWFALTLILISSLDIYRRIDIDLKKRVHCFLYMPLSLEWSCLVWIQWFDSLWYPYQVHLYSPLLLLATVASIANLIDTNWHIWNY